MVDNNVPGKNAPPNPRFDFTPLPPKPASPAPPTTKTSSSSKMPLVAGGSAVALVTIAGLGWLLLSGPSEPTTSPVAASRALPPPPTEPVQQNPAVPPEAPPAASATAPPAEPVKSVEPEQLANAEPPEVAVPALTTPPNLVAEPVDAPPPPPISEPDIPKLVGDTQPEAPQEQEQQAARVPPPAPEPQASAATPEPQAPAPQSSAMAAAPSEPPPPPKVEPQQMAMAPAFVMPPIPKPSDPSQAVEPEMVAIPGGTFQMGSNDDPNEKPLRAVTVTAFSLAKYPVTVREFKACTQVKACSLNPSGEDDAPVTNVSWTDAQQFVTWLASTTGKPYRLPTEAEWEYAARGGTATKYWWGNTVLAGYANCKGCGDPYDAKSPLKVGSFKPNPFGLYDMGGGVLQWVADCWHRTYQGAPKDSSVWDMPNCRERVLRGGSWRNDPGNIRVANRIYYDADVRYTPHGFRVAMSQQ